MLVVEHALVPKARQGTGMKRFAARQPVRVVKLTKYVPIEFSTDNSANSITLDLRP